MISLGVTVVCVYKPIDTRRGGSTTVQCKKSEGTWVRGVIEFRIKGFEKGVTGRSVGLTSKRQIKKFDGW